jgi:Flp pilus assembly protein TadD
MVLVLLAGVAGCSTPVFQTAGGDEKLDDSLNRVARDIEANGNGEEALVLYRRAVVVSGGAPAAYVQLGDAYMRAKRPGPAAAAYRAAAEKDPENAWAHLGLGTALVERGEVAKGLVPLAKAAPLINTPAAYNRLGVAQTVAGRFSDAQATFEKGLEVDPEDIDIATNLALTEALSGDSQEAASMVNTIARHPAVKSVHRRNLVIILGIIGKSTADARAVAPADISQSGFDALVRRAASIRHLTDPMARGRAVGTMQR